MSKHQHIHSTHPQILKRLRRAEGHLHATISMIEDGRGCLELAQQLHAVEKAISNAKKMLIHDHIDHCLAGAALNKNERSKTARDEFRDITKYL
ncbi:MAG: metal-sensing transcriptional repressor [Hyphomicrobiaceae bacterium]|nr:metal-sensing transcriptional repressor [Hyphomicrobiaceae bacterium]